MAQRVVVRPKRKAKFDPADLVDTFRAWAHNKADEERYKGVKERLRAESLFPLLEAHGEVDDKGSYILTFPEAVTIHSLNADGVKKSATYTGIKKEKRPRMKFLEDVAAAWLEKNGLLDKVEVTSTTHVVEWDFTKQKLVKESTETTYLNQDAIFLLNQEELISDKVLDSFFEEEITWALVPIKA